MTIENVQLAVQKIKEFLPTTLHREVISSIEMMDLMLDLLRLIESEPVNEEPEEAVAASCS